MKESKVNHNKKKNKKNAGFYIALALCITAIGGAAWTTYSSVLDYQTPKSENSSNTENSEQKNKQAGKTISGVEYSTDKNNLEASDKTTNTYPESSEEESEEESSEESVDTETSTENSIDNIAQNEYTKPLEGKVIKNFSPENPVYSKTMGDWRTHNGIDISAEDGEKVRAYTDGIVKDVYNDELFGYSVKIEHTNGITMSYCGLSPSTLVKKNDSVSSGDYIGAVFTVPSEIMDKTHLHLIAEKDGKIIDAQAVIENQG